MSNNNSKKETNFNSFPGVEGLKNIDKIELKKFVESLKPSSTGGPALWREPVYHIDDFEIDKKIFDDIKANITKWQSGSNKEKPLLLTDGKELKDLDDLFGLKNKNVSDFTDEDRHKSKIKEILVEAISTVNDPSAISYLSSNEFSFLSQSDNSSVLAEIIAGIDEKNAQIYGVARNVHNLEDKEGYKREILRQKFVLSGLLDPGSRKIIHQSINDEQFMLAFCKEANISYRSILFGFLPEKSQTIENVYEIFADCKDGNKDGNDEKFERFVKATSERYGLVWERLKKLKSEGKINLEDMIDKLEEAIENGDKLGVGVAEVLKSLIDKLDSVEEGNVPPEKTLVLLKKIWEKRRNYSLDENGLETMFSILNDLIQDGMAISDLNGVLKFISDTLNPKNLKVAFNDRAREEMFLLINNILGKNGSSLDNNTVDSMLSALADAIKAGNITGLTTKQVLELINRVIESRLNSGIMADLFKALVNKNGVIESDDTIDSELLKDFFTLINNFAFKEQSTQGDPVRQSMFRTFFEFRQKFIKNKTKLVSKPDVVSILNQMVAFCEERKKNLVGDDILAIVQTLESMMLLGDLSQIDLNEYLPMFTKIWEAAQVVPDSKNLSSIAQYIFGSLFLAIKFGNKDNLANLKIGGIFQLYQDVLKNLQKTETIIRPMFAGLKYALENVKNVTTTQIYNLVKGSGILSDSNFQISIGTAQIIFSVLLAVLKIENRDESKVKSLFDAVNLDSIGLGFREGKIELLDKSKAKDTISCHECINLFYTKLEKIFEEKIFELKVKKEKLETISQQVVRENVEQGYTRSERNSKTDKKTDQTVITELQKNNESSGYVEQRDQMSHEEKKKPRLTNQWKNNEKDAVSSALEGKNQNNIANISNGENKEQGNNVNANQERGNNANQVKVFLYDKYKVIKEEMKDNTVVNDNNNNNINGSSISGNKEQQSLEMNQKEEQKEEQGDNGDNNEDQHEEKNINNNNTLNMNNGNNSVKSNSNIENSNNNNNINNNVGEKTSDIEDEKNEANGNREGEKVKQKNDKNNSTGNKATSIHVKERLNEIKEVDESQEEDTNNVNETDVNNINNRTKTTKIQNLALYFKENRMSSMVRRYRYEHADRLLPESVKESLNKNNFIPVTWTNNFWLFLRNLFFMIIGRKDKVVAGYYYYMSTQIKEDEQKNTKSMSSLSKSVEKELSSRPIMYGEYQQYKEKLV